MKPEPLKDKIIRYELNDFAEGEGFEKQDVVSAVEWLKEMVKTRDLEVLDRQQAVNLMCKLIDEAFADIVEKKEEDMKKQEV